jgi:hypothetical protein
VTDLQLSAPFVCQEQLVLSFWKSVFVNMPFELRRVAHLPRPRKADRLAYQAYLGDARAKAPKEVAEAIARGKGLREGDHD